MRSHGGARPCAYALTALFLAVALVVAGAVASDRAMGTLAGLARVGFPLPPEPECPDYPVGGPVAMP